MFKNLPGFPKKISKSHYFFIVILLLSFFLRFWNIPNTVQFLGDQGRDSLIVSKIFKEKDLVFIGPVTSVGNMYLGPLYYYFMVPFLMLSYPNPLGPVYAVAFLGILTIYLMYVIGKELVGEKAALIGASLMGLSSVVISGTRFSWNPNPAPLVSLLMLYFIFKALKKDIKYWILVVVCFSILIQLHYLTLLSGLGFGILWIWQLYEKIKLNFVNKKKLKPLFTENSSIKKMFFATIIGALVFFLSLTPLVLFDMKHDGLNAQALREILTEEESFDQIATTTGGKFVEFLSETHGRGMHILFEISIGKYRTINTVLLIISLSVLFLALKDKKYRTGKIIITVFILTGIFGTSLYKHTVFNHYIAYLFPVSFLTLGIVGEYLLENKLPGKIVGKLIIAFYLALFITHNITAMRIVMKPVGSRMDSVWEASKTISDRVIDGEKYNIILLTGTGDIDGQNYRYFLSTTDNPPVETEDRGSIDTLFIINDDRVLDKVTDSPIYEIVVFPNKNPSEVYEVPNGPEITVLRRE